MQRKPSIHITEENLQKILTELIQDSPGLAKQILIKARKVSCDNRIISVSKEKVKRDLNKILQADKGDTNLMSTIYFSVRKQLKHKAIQRTKEGSPEWKKIKTLSQIAIDFCNDFELEKREGFIIYIKKGMERINSRRNIIDKLINMSETISLVYEAELVIQDDPHKAKSKAVHDIYVGRIAKATGIIDTHDNNPLNYVYFIRVCEILEKYKVSPQVFIEAQFEGLQWTEGYPSPSQLVTDKAIERLNKYLYKNKKTINTNLSETVAPKLSNILQKIKRYDNDID